MNLQQLRYFLAVAETGGFTKGAERALVSQPTLSAGISKLEGDLGVRLFERDRRRVALTAEGRRFLDHARAIIAEIGAARISLKGDAEKARLRLGILTTITGSMLAGLIGDFVEAVGDIQVELRDGSHAELESRLAAGKIDAALTVLPRSPRDKVDPALPLFRSRLRLALSETNALARASRLSLARAAELPFIVRLHCEFLTESRRRFEAHGLRPHIVYRTTQDERALAMAAAGVGAVLVPDRLRFPGLALLRVAELDLAHTIGLRWRPDGVSETVEAFRTFAASHDWQAEATGQTVARRLGWAH